MNMVKTLLWNSSLAFWSFQIQYVISTYVLDRISTETIVNFQYATTIDLVMGYYGMHLSEKAKKYGVMTLLWGLYQYQRLPQGFILSSDIFQTRMRYIL